MQKQALIGPGLEGLKMVDPAPVHGTRPPDEAVDFVPNFQQEFSEIRTVLTGNAGDQSFLPHGSFLISDSTSRAIISLKGTEFSHPSIRLALAGLPHGPTGSTAVTSPASYLT